MIFKSKGELYIDLRFCTYITQNEAEQRLRASGEKIGKDRHCLKSIPTLCEEGKDRMERRSSDWKFFSSYFNESGVPFLVSEIHEDYCRVIKSVEIQHFYRVLRSYAADSDTVIKFTNRYGNTKVMKTN